MSYENYALNKRVLEYCNHYHPMTDATTLQYDHKQGYLGIHTPSYVTVDLEGVVDIKQIAFKLWDYEDPDNVSPVKDKMTDQIYTYRLLASEDKKCWKVIFDCADLPDREKYHKGWQVFNWSDTSYIKARYIRVHCIHNKRTSGFHIVKMQVNNESINYDSPDVIRDFNCESEFAVEIGDAYPLSYQLMDLSGRLEDMMRDSVSHSTEKSKFIYSDIVDTLCQKSREVEVVNGKVDEIRRLVANPVGNMIHHKFDEENNEKKKNFRGSVFQLIVWLILFIVSIIKNVI